MMKQKIVLATSNLGKVKEMAETLAEFGFDVISQGEFGIESPEETGLTFVENALLKARYASEKSGLPAIADDSGLVVKALNNAPGLYSARYAGVEGENADSANRQKLLQVMQHLAPDHRQAKFVSCLVMIQHPQDPSPIVAEGEVCGEISQEEAGENGFGYDSIFFYPPKNATFAQLSCAEKKAVSHRGIALQVLKSKLK